MVTFLKTKSRIQADTVKQKRKRIKNCLLIGLKYCNCNKPTCVFMLLSLSVQVALALQYTSSNINIQAGELKIEVFEKPYRECILFSKKARTPLSRKTTHGGVHFTLLLIMKHNSGVR